MDGLCRAAVYPGVRLVMSAVVGSIGLRPTPHAVQSGLNVALANKESLVMAGEMTRASHPDVAYYLTGDVVMNRAFTDTTQNEMQTLTPVVFLFIIVASVGLLRSVFGTLAIVATLMFVINTTVGFAGWVGTVFNPANSGVPIIVMTVAIADSVHIVSALIFGMRRGLDKNTALTESLHNNAWPVFLTSTTTAIGFLTLNASDSPPFRVLGNLVAFGVLCAFVHSMALLPALLSVLPLRARPIREGESAFLDRFSAFVVARRTPILWFAALERYEFRRDTDFVIDNLTGMETLEYSLSAGREGGVADPHYLRAVDAFAEWYRGQPEVTHVQAFSDIMKRLNKNMHGVA